MASNKRQMAGPPPGSTRGELLKMIEAHLVSHPSTTPEGFGWAAIKDSYLVNRLRSGGDITTGKLDAVLKYLSQFKRSSTHDKEANA